MTRFALFTFTLFVLAFAGCFEKDCRLDDEGVIDWRECPDASYYDTDTDGDDESEDE